MALTRYQQKRSFKNTPEPKGRLKKSTTKRLEFVIQKHNASHLHYDFRLEMEGVLKSWAVPKGPSLNPKDHRLAMMVEDHPYEYRKFEGDIPVGNYGAGQVIIWDRGTYEPRAKSKDAQKTLLQELKDGHLSFVMHGQKLRGEFALIRNRRVGNNAWLLIKKDDESASGQDVTLKNESVVSGETIRSDDQLDLQDAPKSKMPQDVRPMLATLADEPFDGQDWLYEIKWDGYRALGAWDGKIALLYSRRGQDFSDNYPPVYEALRSLKKPVLVDGEIVAVDSAGISRFEMLQNYRRQPEGRLLYYVFDILWCDGRDLTGLPLENRKHILKAIVPEDSIIRYSDHIIGQGKKFFETASGNKLEGIMAKERGSTYRPGQRTESWLKIKTHLRQEAIICGFTEPRGSRKYIGAFILGIYKGGRLTYVGHAGGGGNSALLKELRQNLEKLEVEESPFEQKVRPNAPVHWVKPKILCEVSFSEWTKDGRMRQPIFKGIRTDKPAKEVSMEKPVKTRKRAAKLEFSHLEKVFWPEKGYIKGDLVEYYRRVAELMMPYIRNRPHSLLRQPNGYKGKSFFQKDIADVAPDWLKTARIYSESNQKDIEYLVADSADSLLWMVQMGCIEINPWNSRVGSLDKPDWIVLDLDPEDIGFDKVIQVALSVKEVTDSLDIPAYPKTSGKTGIHIFIPLKAKYDYGPAKQFGEILAHLVHDKTADITSLERSPSRRQKKIYIDFLQNRQGQTLAAPYSARPTKDASVSTPLRWKEINSKLDPSKFTIKSIFKRIDKVGDLWQPVIKEGIDIRKILKKLE